MGKCMYLCAAIGVFVVVVPVYKLFKETRMHSCGVEKCTVKPCKCAASALHIGS